MLLPGLRWRQRATARKKQVHVDRRVVSESGVNSVGVNRVRHSRTGARVDRGHRVRRPVEGNRSEGAASSERAIVSSLYEWDDS